MNSPQIICCSCGGGPVYRLTPPLCIDCDPELERKAANLWRAENPQESVFNCSPETKIKYRRLALNRAGGEDAA